jgi:hypothetical protein
MIPSYGKSLFEDQELCKRLKYNSETALGLNKPIFENQNNI